MSKADRLKEKEIKEIESKNKPITWCVLKPVECRFDCKQTNCKLNK